MNRLTRKEKKRPYHAFVLTILFIWFAFVLLLTVLGRKPFEGLHFQPEVFWSYRSEQMKEAWFIGISSL